MAKKTKAILYTGTAEGQAGKIVRSGYFFQRDTVTHDVPELIANALLREEGFEEAAPEKKADKSSSSAKAGKE